MNSALSRHKNSEVRFILGFLRTTLTVRVDYVQIGTGTLLQERIWTGNKNAQMLRSFGNKLSFQIRFDHPPACGYADYCTVRVRRKQTHFWRMAMRWFSLVLVFLFVGETQAVPPAPGLEIYFIDTEGGAATLIVTPLRESILIDSGNPGSRDAERIHKEAQKARLKQIDHLITTHWHSDHYGGVARLSKLIPIRNFYDHGIPKTLDEDKTGFPILIEAYKEATAGKSKTLKAGDSIELRQGQLLPPMKLQCICGSGKVIADKPDAPKNPRTKDHKAKPEDTSDNARSLGFLLSYGNFRFLDLGDLTWNIEYQLVHPSDKIGLVDVYQVTHHGLDISNNPVLVQTVQPRVAICNNGARKGAAAAVISTLRRVEGIEGIYQLHKNVTVGDAENTDAEFIANKEEKCQGESIHLRVDQDGKSYRVTAGSGKPHDYKTRER